MNEHQQRAAWSSAADLGLLALAIGTSASCIRLFVGWEFLARLAPLLLMAWALPVILRRARLGVAPAMALHLAVGLVAVTVRFAPGTHLFGLPTPRSFRALGDGIDASFAEFSELVAPVQVTAGFLIVIAAAMWVFAFFADTAAMRYRGVVQAAIPYLAVFLTLGVLARGPGRTAATLWFGVGLAVYAVTQQGRSMIDRRWVAGQAARGATSVSSIAAVTVAATVAAALLVAPLLPGEGQPVVDLRKLGRGDGPRTAVSPFVGIRSLLGERSDQVVFTVDAEVPAYWRLTALDTYDEARQIWVSSGAYSSARGILPAGGASSLPGTTVRQSYTMVGLTGPWLPAAYVPSRVTSRTAVGFDERSASLIDRDGSDDPVSYALESNIPAFGDPGRAVPGRGTDRVSPEHLATPDLAAEVHTAVEEATSVGGTDLDRMVALQNWFRSRFAYDERVDYTTEGDPLVAFLEQRRGFCQQFSSAFALMARSRGLPARIAVGFTPGDAERSDVPGRTRYVVRGRHAHAWPEVYLEGMGWVPFEPTPQRGDPQSTGHTGVAPAQARPPENERATERPRPDPTTSSVPQAPTSTPARPEPTTAQPGRDTAPSVDDTDGAGPGALAVLLVLAGCAVLAAVVTRRRRRRGPRSAVLRRGPERAGVAVAWQDATRSLERIGLRVSESETPLEFADRVCRSLDTADHHHADGAAHHLSAVAAAIVDVAEAETSARYREAAPTQADTEAARHAVRVIRDGVPHLSAVATTRSSRG